MKYKKLDNLDDLRVGDVVIDPSSTEWKILKVKDGMAYFPCVPVTIYTIETLKEWGWTAKRPLPEKKEKVKNMTEERKWEEEFRTKYGHLIWKYENSIVESIKELRAKDKERLLVEVGKISDLTLRLNMEILINRIYE